MSLLSFNDVSYRYPGTAADALRTVNLSFEAGEFCLVTGLSGSGKSTLLRAAAGLVPHFHGGCFSGAVTIDGLDTKDHGPAEIGAIAGTLLQDPETQIVMATVRAELELPLENLGCGAAGIARAVEETALALGIEQLLERPTSELSGGELQRVALAAALVCRPRIVLLDEPTSQLDPVAGDELIWQLHRLNQQSDTAVILVEHRVERCLAAADRVVALADGAVVCDRDPAGFLEWAAEHAPLMQTPGARLFDAAGLPDRPVGVKQARMALRRYGLLRQSADRDNSPAVPDERPSPWQKVVRRIGGVSDEAPALELRDVWHELRNGPAILRGVNLRIRGGEGLVLMGRNGAGKSTLLRHAAGLLKPTRGEVKRNGRIALLLQNPGDYFLHERVEEELSERGLASVGLSGFADRHPRDLSGGQRQRLALAIVLDGEQPASTVALDEPTRGMDRAAKQRLTGWLRERMESGQAVIVATHDAEFAAEFATRVVLLAAGRVIADGPIDEILAGGWYFATETARILGGAGGALRPQEGASLLLARRAHTDSIDEQDTVTEEARP
ncbi:MAG TPA: ATP-binding cassette domain-containing protein [Solirubrobacteraceae bacterium]